jgi:manganese/iron transport system ATP-binding protein
MALKSFVHKSVPHRSDAPVVDFSHVTVRYHDDAPALEDVSFSVARSERIAIVGPNGAGKSTLLKVTAGILAPSSGHVEVYGYGAGGHICIGYVPQRTQVDWSFPVTVADVVMMGRVARLGLFRQAGRKDWDRVRKSLAQVHMEKLAERQIGELSGGQQQRVFIARAMAQEAELLLMDEPLTGLDVPAQEAIFTILDDLKARGMTVLVSTHDLHLAADRFDRLMLLKHRLLGIGQAVDVLTPANLRQAYGGQMTVLPLMPAEEVLGKEELGRGEAEPGSLARGALVFGDTCCDGSDEHEEHSHA